MERSPKRDEILLGVLAVVAEKGIEAVSIRSVAAAAGVSPGRVQHHFGTRTELVRSGVTFMLELAAGANPETLTDPSDPDTLWALLTHALAPADESRRGTSVYFSFVAAGVADPWIADELAAAKRGVVELVATCLAAQHPGVSDRAAAARELVALSDGATQAVYLGWMEADTARAVVRSALARLPNG